MKRRITDELIRWKDSPRRKPLLITGVRQCGKTYVMKAFAEEFFERVAYINFERETRVRELFEYDLNPERIVRELGSLYFGYPIEAGRTILIFDEIQECPKAITSLKYFCEDLPELHVMCAGSLLTNPLARAKRKKDFRADSPVFTVEAILPLSIRLSIQERMTTASTDAQVSPPSSLSKYFWKSVRLSSYLFTVSSLRFFS